MLSLHKTKKYFFYSAFLMKHSSPCIARTFETCILKYLFHASANLVTFKMKST